MAPQPTIEKMILSGSTNGRPVKIAATSTPGTLIHTAVSGTDSVDEVWVYLFNSDTTARKVTLELGGTTSPDDTAELTIPPEAGLVLAIAGLPYNNAVVIRAFCASANVVMATGFVNRLV